MTEDGLNWDSTGVILSEDPEEGYGFAFMKLDRNGTMEAAEVQQLLP